MKAIHPSGARLRHPAMLVMILVASGCLMGTVQADERSMPASSFAALEGLDNEAMEAARGKEGGANLTVVASIQDLKSTVNDASFWVGRDLVTGDINIQADSMGTHNGAAIYNFNTGLASSLTGGIGISVYMNNPGQ